MLGRAPSGEALDRVWERQSDLPWRVPARWAQSALESLVPSAGRRGVRRSLAELERRVDRILHGLARRLERDGRSRKRRTRHAEVRHASGGRPTRKALDDACAAGPGELLVDERRGTLVVLGARGRTHFFTPEGQLVSSVRYSRDAIERKLKQETWRPATREQREQLRGNLPA